MAGSWIVPFLGGVVGALFAAKVWGQWSVRRRPHQLAWAAGLTMFALASFVDTYVTVSDWNVPVYRFYFVVAAGNVGLLGLGTILLTRIGIGRRIFAAFVILGLVVAAVGQLSVPLAPDTPVTIDDETRPLALWDSDLGAKPIPMPNPGRIAFLLLNVVGGLALIGGALLSWWQTRRLGVLLIGAGAMFPFIGGSLSTLFAIEQIRTIFTLVGVAVMFFGYLSGREA